MRNRFSFSSGGGVERREREREIVGKKKPIFFKYSLGKNDCLDSFHPQSKDHEFFTIARFFFNFAGMRLKDRLVFMCVRKWW